MMKKKKKKKKKTKTKKMIDGVPVPCIDSITHHMSSGCSFFFRSGPWRRTACRYIYVARKGEGPR
jgi:hypothetical protein